MRKSSIPVLLLFAVSSITIAAPLPAQLDGVARPKVALVLSGGGARGGAHIGVLKALEEQHIPIDIIVGTSAGAIVGSAYASGMPLAEIERVMQTLSTASLVHDVDRRDLSVARKSDDEGSYVGPEFGIGANGLSLPKGAVSGVALEGVLRRLTARQASDSFDQLPIPFRAIATDVASGDMVVLAKGNLALAIRASMAIPAVLTPVEIDGLLLVDGSIARNLPIDVARSLGADIVIAVNIGTPLLKREEIKSVLSMSDQMTRMLTSRNVSRSLAELSPRDVLITPDLGSVSADSFDLLKQAEASGLAAGRAAAGELQRYALAKTDYLAHVAARRDSTPSTGIKIDAVEIVGTQRVQQDALLGGMETKAGELFDPAMAERDMRRLYGRGDFEHVGYAVNQRADGSNVMTTTVSEKSWGPQFLRLGLGVSTDFEGDSFFSLRASHRWSWLNSLGAEWRNDVEIGHADRLSTEWLQPLTPAHQVFASIYLSGERTPFDLYNDGDRLARFRRQSVTGGVDLGVPVQEWGEARIGISRGHVRMLNDTSFVPATALLPSARTAGVQLRVRTDTLDNRVFPRSGLATDLQVYSSRKNFGADDNYNKLSFSAQQAFATGAHSLVAAIDVQRKMGGNELPDVELISFGGFLKLSGYRTGELVGNSLHFGRLVYNYRISGPGLLDGVYLGFSAELGRMGDTIDAQNGQQTARSNAVYLAVDTPLGPLYLGAGRATRDRSALYLMIGKP
jgi:NTE family protein